MYVDICSVERWSYSTKECVYTCICQLLEKINVFFSVLFPSSPPPLCDSAAAPHFYLVFIKWEAIELICC
jgi:hypothetical protein